VSRIESRAALGQRTFNLMAAAWVAVASALLLGLAGCAAQPGPKSNTSSSEAAPYVGVFTGEFVDGKPLYRFPSIFVTGSRKGVDD